MSEKRRTPRRRRDKERTRQALLEAGFREVYVRGFQASDLKAILRSAGLTKGAFFHHFPSKLAFGHAIVDEVISGMLRRQWAVPLETSKDPLRTIADSFKAGIEYLASLPVHHGCPLNNLAQEMSSLDEGFRSRIRREFGAWKATYSSAFEKAKSLGQISRTFPSEEGAHHLLALVEGTLSLAKASQRREDLEAGHRSVVAYFNLLKQQIRR